MPEVPQLSAPRARIVKAALDLFARQGVAGTSLQMIADEVGVTKAAVYCQYKTKEEIVSAVAEAELSNLERVIAVAEKESVANRSREKLITGMVEVAVDRRRTSITILNDPAVVGLFLHDERFESVLSRLQKLLIGVDDEPGGAVRTAMLMAAISGAVMHPLVKSLDSETLKAELSVLARSFLASARNTNARSSPRRVGAKNPVHGS